MYWDVRHWESDAAYQYLNASTNAMQEYTGECDSLQQFITENYTSQAGCKTILKDFTAHYKLWSSENGLEVKNSNAVAVELRKKGYEVVNGSRNSVNIISLGRLDNLV